MSNRLFERKFNRAVKCAAILRYLREEGAIPYLSIAAERAGVSRAQARAWMAEARTVPETVDASYLEIAEWAAEVNRIKAEWIHNAVKDLAKGDVKSEAERKDFPKHLQWILTTLDNETFEPPKKVANVVKEDPDAATKPAEAPSADDIAAAAAALALNRN